MANAQAFGRRASSVPSRARAQNSDAPAAPAEPVAMSAIQAAPAQRTDPMAEAEDPMASVEEELRQWKASRRMKIPWRQISLMASLCFGVASFELPDSVNDEVSWLLYGLMAVSFYVGVSGWFKKRVDAAAERKLRDTAD